MMTRIVASISWTIVFLALIITGAPSPQVRFSFSDSSSLDSQNTFRIVATTLTHTWAVTISWMKS